MGCPSRWVRAATKIVALVVAAIALATSGLAAKTDPEPTPKRGGTLEFAVEGEPTNYDCHANSSFAFLVLHPPEVRRGELSEHQGRLGGILEGVGGQAGLYVHIAAQRAVS
jgi:hypothetical protein